MKKNVLNEPPFYTGMSGVKIINLFNDDKKVFSCEYAILEPYAETKELFMHDKFDMLFFVIKGKIIIVLGDDKKIELQDNEYTLISSIELRNVINMNSGFSYIITLRDKF